MGDSYLSILRADGEEMTTITDRLKALADFVKAESIKQDVWETEKNTLLFSVKDKRTLSTVLLSVTELFKQLGGESEEQVLRKIQDFVSYGLSLVFGADYSFIAELGTEGKDLKVEISIRTGELQSDVTNAKGGGVAEVVSILLQLFFVFVSKGTLSQFIILDASLIHLSEKYWKNMSRLLQEISNKLNLQVVLLAHAGDYGEYADVLYEFSQKNGRTQVRRVK